MPALCRAHILSPTHKALQTFGLAHQQHARVWRAVPMRGPALQPRPGHNGCMSQHCTLVREALALPGALSRMCAVCLCCLNAILNTCTWATAFRNLSLTSASSFCSSVARAACFLLASSSQESRSISLPLTARWSCVCVRVKFTPFWSPLVPREQRVVNSTTLIANPCRNSRKSASAHTHTQSHIGDTRTPAIWHAPLRARRPEAAIQRAAAAAAEQFPLPVAYMYAREFKSTYTQNMQTMCTGTHTRLHETRLRTPAKACSPAAPTRLCRAETWQRCAPSPPALSELLPCPQVAHACARTVVHK